MTLDSMHSLAVLAFGVLLLCSSAFAAEKPLDEHEPPFGSGDYSWLKGGKLNGGNHQPDSLLKWGPLTGSVFVDAYYAFQFSQPADHTIFQTTTAPRHNEIALNLVALGVEISGLNGPIGRLYLQAGSNVETDWGQDASTQRGQFLSLRAFAPVQQAAVGWHFVRFRFHPYYFAGTRTQFFLQQNLKLELWLVNGWQTFGQWHETRAGGYQFNVRPSQRLSINHSTYVGKDEPADPHAVRLYADNFIQWQWLKGGPVKSSALAVVADIGWEHRSRGSSGWMTGGSVSDRVEFDERGRPARGPTSFTTRRRRW